MGLVPSRLPAPLVANAAANAAANTAGCHPPRLHQLPHPLYPRGRGGTPMDRHSVQWSGPMPAVVTPFDAAGRVDEAAFTANVERLLTAGATGIVAGGCTGEFWALSVAERAALYGLAVRTV